MDAVSLPDMAGTRDGAANPGSALQQRQRLQDVHRDGHKRDVQPRRDVHRQGQKPASHADILASISQSELHKAAFWLNTLGEDWRGDIPLRLHEGGLAQQGAAPPFSSEFIRYVGYLECSIPECGECKVERAKTRNAQGWRNPESRLRATRAFRKLRKIAPREFDALYLYCISRYTVSEIAKALTERAVRLGHPERYDRSAVFLLMLSGIDKVIHFW